MSPKKAQPPSPNPTQPPTLEAILRVLAFLDASGMNVASLRAFVLVSHAAQNRFPRARFGNSPKVHYLNEHAPLCGNVNAKGAYTPTYHPVTCKACIRVHKAHVERLKKKRETPNDDTA